MLVQDVSIILEITKYYLHFSEIVSIFVEKLILSKSRTLRGFFSAIFSATLVQFIFIVYDNISLFHGSVIVGLLNTKKQTT